MLGVFSLAVDVLGGRAGVFSLADVLGGLGREGYSAWLMCWGYSAWLLMCWGGRAGGIQLG